MTIKSTYIAVCDGPGCDVELRSEELDPDMYFNDFIQALRDSDWKNHRSRATDEWNHFCPSCKK